jgi:hypothetical protein
MESRSEISRNRLKLITIIQIIRDCAAGGANDRNVAAMIYGRRSGDDNIDVTY